MATQTVTILFTDLVGSTELLTRLGDDANDRVRRDFFAAMREQIAAHGGVEVKTIGDNIMAAFTTSAADAVSCAVAMQRAVGRLNDRDPLLGLAVRMGLSLGEASFEEEDWFGTPVVEAARLESAARPQQILAADVIRIVVGSRGGHTFTSVGALELKGLPDAVAASEVAWEPDPGLPAIPLPSGLDRSGLPFAGREPALQTLQRAWDAAQTDTPTFALITGESGIGKTRLAAEFAARIHADDTIVLYGRSDTNREIPYQPFTEALRW
ncbi:MAG: adenylate/guanylate cyclase domain-containing protein, partial [Chloroflexi bacterium]|nr:adenylate/guanylate cyclase domain-containing protein [Chloroflexota bacterium]